MAGARDSHTSCRIDVRLLGRFSVHAAGIVGGIALPHDGERLLAYLLLLPGRRTSRERAERDLWGSEAAAPRSLDSTLLDLRNRLESMCAGDVIEVTPAGEILIRPDAGVRVDADEFEAAASEVLEAGPCDAALLESRALAAERLYEGHLLEEWTEEWVSAPRNTARRRYLALLDELLRSFEATGDDARVILYATRALAAAPVHESAHWHLIAALHRLGDDAGALRQFQRMVEVLRREEGRDPDWTRARRAIAETLREPGAYGRPARRESSD
jgi:DNA-binding SARP family transcriptional activator